MRLNHTNRQIICEAVRELFGDEAKVLVFGSRTDSSVRGGDIDLLVELPRVMQDEMEKGLKLTARLQRRLGDQRIDVIVVDPETPRRPIHDEAMRTGVRL